MVRRVVVTGMGILSPVGHNVEESWAAITAGKSGIGPITRYDASDHPVRIAGEIKDWDPEKYMLRKEARRQSLFQQFIVAAAHEAIESSGYAVDEDTPERSGTMIGSSVGGIESLLIQHQMLLETGDPRRVTPFGIPMLMANGGSNLISIQTGATGPSHTMVSACATGADCIGLAFDLIRSGRLDQALAGAADAPVIEIGIASFDRAGALSHENDNPSFACRPFDRDRKGLVFSEGAGVLVLEELERAKKRGARILAELIGYSSTCDAFHMTAPDPDSRGAALAVRQALQDAKVDTDDVDYINAHGTGTTLNDPMETRAIKHVFGEKAYNIPMSSTKSMTGHGMGATAAIEAAFAILAMRDGLAPPTINLENPDPACDLDYVPNQAREMIIDVAMSNSFGFGGHNCCLVFRKFEG